MCSIYNLFKYSHLCKLIPMTEAPSFFFLDFSYQVLTEFGCHSPPVSPCELKQETKVTFSLKYIERFWYNDNKTNEQHVVWTTGTSETLSITGTKRINWLNWNHWIFWNLCHRCNRDHSNSFETFASFAAEQYGPLEPVKPLVSLGQK